MAKRIQLRRDIASNWERVNPRLAQGEIGVDITAKNFKIGDGTNNWNSLDYAIVTGKLGLVGSDTYIEIGEGSDAGTIFFYNAGVETVKLNLSELRTNRPVLLNANQESLNPYTGTLVVQGGVGISGDLNIQGDLQANSILVEEDIVSDIVGNVTGNVFGDLIGGNLRADNGTIIVETGATDTDSVFKGRLVGLVTSTGGTSSFSSAVISSGSVDGAVIGGTTPNLVTGTIITATNKFQGNLTGNLNGDIYANNGTNKILENGTNGTDAVFYGKVEGTSSGRFVGDVYAADDSTKILENGTDGTNAIFTGQVNGNVNSVGVSIFNNIDVNGGAVDNTLIGVNIPSRIIGTTITATEKFIGEFQGTITGPSTGDIFAENGIKVLDNGTTGLNSIYHGDIHVYIPNANDPANPFSVKILNKGTDGTDASFIGSVTGNVTGNLTGNVSGTSVNTGSIDTTGNVDIGGNLSVDGTATFTGNISAPNLTANNSGLNVGNLAFTVAGATGDTNIQGNLTVLGTTSFTGTTTATDIDATTLDTTGAVTIGTTLDVAGAVDINGAADIAGNVNLSGTLTVAGGSTFAAVSTTSINNSGNISVYGANNLIQGKVTLNSPTLGPGADDIVGGVVVDNGKILTTTLVSSGSATIGTTLQVNSNATVTGSTTSGSFIGQQLDVDNVQIDGNKIKSTTGNLGIETASVTDKLQITSQTFIVADNPNPALAESSFTMKGAVTAQGTLDVTGTTTMATVDINGGTIDNTVIGSTTPAAITATDIDAEDIIIKNYGELRLREANVNGNNYVGIRAPQEFTNSYTLTMPSVLGVDGALLTFNNNGNKLEFSSPDLFGGGQVSVSADYGNDSFDGINKPVKTIKRALQIASGLVYSQSVQFDLDICRRDTGLIIDAIGWDLAYNSNWQTVKSGLAYSLQPASYVLGAQKELTVNALIYLKSRVISAIGGAEGTLAGNKAQIVISIVNAGVPGIIPTIGAGSVPAVSMPTPTGADTEKTYAKNALLDNVAFIRDEVNAWILNQIQNNTAPFTSSFVYGATEQAKCKRDLEYMVYSVAYDIIYGGNSQTVDAGLKYWDGIGSTAVLQTTDPQETAAAIEYAKYVAGQVILDQNPTTLYSATPRLSSNAAPTITSELTSLFNIIGNILINGVQTAPAIVYPSATFTGASSAAALGQAKNLLSASKLQIQTNTVSYAAKFTPNDKRIIVSVASGEYVEDNPIIIPDNVSVVGAGLRACNIRPANANKDMLRVRNGCYFTEITFRDYLNANKVPSHTFDYAVSFDDPSDLTCDRAGYINLPNTKPTITISPYVQNCSIISFLGGNGVLVDGNKVQTPNVPKNQIEAENPVEGPAPQQGKSMVANAFTMLSFGGTGWRVINDAYAQIVSCFQIFCLNGSYCQSGGYLSITNSATNFGQFALRASGYSPNAFDFNKGTVIELGTSGAQQTITAIGFEDLPVQHYIIRFRNPAFRQAYYQLISNKEEIENTVISWINAQITAATISSIWYQFTYVESKCRRDIGLLIEAIAYDILTGGNSKSVEAGLSYSLANSATLNNQEQQNIAAFQQVKAEAIIITTPSGVQNLVSDKFDLLLSIIADPGTAPDSIEYSAIGDITNNYKFSDPNDELTFNANSANPATDSLTVVAHGLPNGSKVVYSNNGNSSILGLNNEQAYYVDFVDVDTIRLWNDDSKTTRADIKAIGSGTHKLIKNVREFFIDDLITSHRVYQEITLPIGTYEFVIGRLVEGTTSGQPNRGFVHSYDATIRKLTLSIELVTVGLVQQRNEFNINSIITADHKATPSTNISITSISNTSKYFTAQFKILPTISGSSLVNLATLPEKQIWLHRPSIVNSSGHTWEYAGSGIDYNALPQNGGKTRVAYEQVSDLPGRVYSSGTNELGDFKVGDFIKAENKTGNVQFTNTVSIAALDALKLAVGNIQIDEFSSDIDLGDNEIGGPSDSRLSTQLAVRSFLENRLGNFIDREVSTNNVAGAVPQLNALGKLNPEVIPPIRNFLVYRSNGYRTRLDLVKDVPPTNVQNGDLATENYATQQITLSGNITQSDGTSIIQGSGARGKIVGNVVNTNTILVASEGLAFNTAFVVSATTLTIAGSSTAITVTAVQPVLNDQSTNYFLSEAVPSQFLILDSTQTYNFAGITAVLGAVSSAQGNINTADYTNGLELGVLNSVNLLSLPVGTGYTQGIYYNIPLTNITGTGSGAVADITVNNLGQISSVDLKRGGDGYAFNNQLSAATANIGGTGTGFSLTVNEIQNRLHINSFGGLKFTANLAVPDYIEDANAVSKTITNTATIEKTFTATSSGVNTSTSRITITAHGLSNGDPVQYDPNGQSQIQGLLINGIYYVKVIDTNTIELYNNYNLDNPAGTVSKVILQSTGTGTQKLIIQSVDLEDFRIYLPAHGYITGSPVKVIGTNVPSPLKSNYIYFTGAVTTNSFTLHAVQSDADDSTLGDTINPVEIGNKGSGTTDFRKQNIRVIGAIDTSSKSIANWSNISASTIDAVNIISGTVNPSRLGSGTANTTTFLRGDSSWARAVQNIKKATSTTAISLTGNFENIGGTNEYYNSVSIDVAVVDGSPGNIVDNHTNLGVAKFYEPQFDVGSGASIGQVRIKNGVVDAGSLDGQDGLWYTDSANHTTQIVTKGGTGITSYAIGDILYANATNSLQKLAIGTANKVMVSTGADPSWSDSLTIKNLTVNGDVSINGAKSTLNAYDIRMDDNNIELGSVIPITNRTGIINFTGGGSLTTSVTADTTGMIPGMALTKVSGAGAFGNNPIVTSIDSATQFSFIADTAHTIGSIVFNAGGATDYTADGGGLTIKSTSNKTFQWARATNSWTSNDNLNLVVNKEYKINNVSVLSSDTVLGKKLTSSAGDIVTSGSYWVRTFAFMGT